MIFFDCFSKNARGARRAKPEQPGAHDAPIHAVGIVPPSMTYSGPLIELSARMRETRSCRRPLAALLGV